MVANNRLVGVVSQQALVPVAGQDPRQTRIPFAKVIKAKFIRGLLDDLAAADHALATDTMMEYLMKREK